MILNRNDSASDLNDLPVPGFQHAGRFGADKVAPVGAGEQHLGGFDPVDQPAAAQRVQLAEHVVQKQQRRLPLAFVQQVKGGQLEGQRRRPQLPLGPKGLQVVSGQGQQQVVPVGADGGRHPPELLLPPGRKLAEHVRLRFLLGQGALVGQAEAFLFPPADKGIVPEGLFVQRPGRLGPQAHQRGRRLGQLLVPDRQLGAAAALGDLLEQGVPLAQGRVVGLQSVKIRPLQLGKQHVQETPPHRRPVPHHGKILGAEDDAGGVADQIPHAGSVFAVDVQELFSPLVQKQAHADVVRAVPPFHKQLHRGAFLPAADHVLIVVGPVGAAQAAQMNGLQQVGFPRAVFPDDDRHALRRSQRQVLIAAKVLQSERFQPHGRSFWFTLRSAVRWRRGKRRNGLPC